MIQEPDWGTRSTLSPVPVEIRAAIGSVVIFQASIEYELRLNISRLLGIDSNTIETATVELSYRQLIALLSSLVISKIGKASETYDDFAAVIGKLDEFESFRNSVAHSHWSRSLAETATVAQAGRQKSTATRGQGLRRAAVEVGLPEMKLHLNKAAFYNTELFALIGRIASGTVP